MDTTNHTPTTILAFLKNLGDLDSEERRLYRERKVAHACPFCGEKNPPNTYCDSCYAMVKTARARAIAEGTCANCYSAPIAPPRGRYHGVVTHCLKCRDAAMARKMDQQLRSILDL